jgi:hypothetical protein
MNKLDDITDKFDILISLLHEVRNTRGDVDGRGVSVAITHLETSRLWFEDAAKDVELSATSEEPVT